MVKPDVGHNYYRDLELPTNASIDDVRKAYRKLALQYHPDRNGGREDECVPKFQAIQAANEVLGDPTLKQKYDIDRRKAGLYGGSNFNPRTTTPNSQYQATSAYPPPPRRTQPPPTAQRPTSGGAPPPPPPPGAGSGADRFANFSRPNSARKDPAQDRTNAFKAWQNWNASGTHTQGGPQRQPNAPPPPPPGQQAPPPQPQANRRAPPPPPPRDPKMPPEDPTRPGPKFKAPPPFDPKDTVNERASAWGAAFSKPGMPPPNNAFNSPKKPFPQNAPGPGKPADRPNINVQPPRQNGPPPPMNSPTTPISPKTARPRPDPLHPFKSRAPPEAIPFAEGNRVSTPYTKSFAGEQKDFFGDTLRRSASVKDNTKLAPEDGSTRARARSSSPHRPNKDTNQNKFEMPGSSEESGSDADMTQTPEEADSSPTDGQQERPGTAPNSSTPFDRPKKVPSSRYNGARNEERNRAQSDSEQQGRPHSSRSHMYADPSSSSFSSSSSSFSSQAWQSHMFGTNSTSGARRGSSSVPGRAIPSSLNPVLRSDSQRSTKKTFVTAADERFTNATEDEQRAYLRFQEKMRKEYDGVPANLDMDVFLKLISRAQRSQPSGDAVLDEILIDILRKFDVGVSQDDLANQNQHANRFDNHARDDSYATYGSRHRSEENINTSFSEGNFNGEFVGEPDYVAPPGSTRRKQASPARRPPNSRGPTSQPRSTTMDDYTSAPHMEVPQRPYGSDGTPNQSQRTTPMGSGYDRDGQVQDSNWTWPPPPPPPPHPPNQAKQSNDRKTSNNSNRATSGTREQPHVVDDDSTEAGGAAVYDGDAMDIDDTPPSHHTGPRSKSQENGARPYFQPVPEWAQQHDKKETRHRKSSSASRRSQHRGTANGGGKFNANFDDLRASLAQSTQGGDGLDLSGMNSTLPFQSQSSTTMYGDPQLPRDLRVPPIPKPPPEPQRLSKASWQSYAAGFGEYIKAFHSYNATLLQHFESREQQAQAQIASGMGWLEATGDTSGRLTAPTGFGEYMRGVKEDEKVREAWKLAWERHGDAIRGFEKVRDLLRKLVVGGSLVDN